MTGKIEFHKPRILLFLTILLFVFSSCETYDMRLKVSNKTENTIYFIISKSENYNVDNLNELLNEKEPTTYYVRKLDSKSTENISKYGSNAWYYYVLKECDDEMHVYFFDETTVLNNSWEKIYSSRLELKYQKYSLVELEKNNWEVKYEK